MRTLLRSSLLSVLVLLGLLAYSSAREAARLQPRSPATGSPGIWVYPAAPCKLILYWYAFGDSTHGFFGFSVGGGKDINSDGRPDLVVGAMLADRVRIFNNFPSPLDYFEGTGNPGTDYGRSIDMMADFSGDGRNDVIVGASGHSGAGNDSCGVVTAWDGVLNFSWIGDHVGDKLGYSVADAGDMDGDGFEDIIAGAPEAAGPVGAGGLWQGYALLLSPRTNSVIHRYDGAGTGDRFGHAVASAGDFNKDGWKDVIIGAPMMELPRTLNAVGAAIVYSRTGQEIWRFNGENTGDYFGSSVANAGDVDNDGYLDVIIGAWRADPGGSVDAGSAYVYSGKTHALIYRFDGEGPNHNFGYSVDGAGDIDQDGYDDLIVGAHGADLYGTTDGGCVYVYSGREGELMWRLSGDGDNGQYFGVSVANVGDMTQDGRPDFIAGAFGTDTDTQLEVGSAWFFGCWCDCPCKYDPQCDSVVSDILDVTQTINVAFRGQEATKDPDCRFQRSDVDASGATDVLDVTKVINVAFRGQAISANYVEPCPIWDF